MLKELKRSDLRRPRTKKGPLLRSRERESRSLEKCIKLERMLRSKELREISLRNTPTSGLRCTHQSQEMVFPWIRKLTSMKFNLRRCRLTKVSRSSADHYQAACSRPKSVWGNLNTISRVSYQEVSTLILPNWRRLRQQLTFKSSSKSN